MDSINQAPTNPESQVMEPQRSVQNHKKKSMKLPLIIGGSVLALALIAVLLWVFVISGMLKSPKEQMRSAMQNTGVPQLGLISAVQQGEVLKRDEDFRIEFMLEGGEEMQNLTLQSDAILSSKHRAMNLNFDLSQGGSELIKAGAYLDKELLQVGYGLQGEDQLYHLNYAADDFEAKKKQSFLFQNETPGSLNLKESFHSILDSLEVKEAEKPDESLQKIFDDANAKLYHAMNVEQTDTVELVYGDQKVKGKRLEWTMTTESLKTWLNEVKPYFMDQMKRLDPMRNVPVPSMSKGDTSMNPNEMIESYETFIKDLDKAQLNVSGHVVVYDDKVHQADVLLTGLNAKNAKESSTIQFVSTNAKEPMEGFKLTIGSGDATNAKEAFVVERSYVEAEDQSSKDNWSLTGGGGSLNVQIDLGKEENNQRTYAINLSEKEKHIIGFAGTVEQSDKVYRLTAEDFKVNNQPLESIKSLTFNVLKDSYDVPKLTGESKDILELKEEDIFSIITPFMGSMGGMASGF